METVKKAKKRIIPLVRPIICVLLVLSLIVGSFSGVVCFKSEEKVAKAAEEGPDISIFDTVDGITMDPEKTGGYDMRTGAKTIQVQSGAIQFDDPSHYLVEWKILQGQDKAQFNDPNVTPTPAPIYEFSGDDFVTVYATSPGDVIISVKVTNKKYDPSSGTDNWQKRETTCHLNIIFAVDTSGSYFKQVYDTDLLPSLVLYSNSPEVPMSLNFGSVTKASWTMDNEEIAKVGLHTGIVTAVGAGCTTLNAEYRPDDAPEKIYTAHIKVYVVPMFKKTDESTYKKADTIDLYPGDSFNVDTYFRKASEGSGSGGILNRIYWSIRKESGSGQTPEIANSAGKKSELIEIIAPDSRENVLKLKKGVSGKYYVDLYVYDSDHAGDITSVKTSAYTPSTITLVVNSSIENNRNVVLGTYDRYNLASAYNMSVDDFRETFKKPVITMENGALATNYYTYNENSCVLTAKDKIGKIKAVMEVQDGKESYVRSLLGTDETYPADGKFVTHIEIIDGITLGEEAVVITVGQEYQLNASVHGTYDGTINWSSSNTSCVTVDTTGLIKGVKVTTDDVTVTASIEISGGIVRTASCQVKVEQAVTNFTLSPGTDQRMNVGEYLTVVANIKETVSKAPLEWMSSDPAVFSVAPAADGKSALITALAGGTATLIVRNTTNNNRVDLKITVVVPIEQLAFKEAEYTCRFYQIGKNLSPELNVGPANATEKELSWNINDTSVATIDQSGYLKFKTPGTVVIRVTPIHNPNMLYATATVHILGTPDNIEFENLKDNTLNIEVSEEKLVNLKFDPPTATTVLIWRASKPGIVRLAYDDERRQLSVIGQSVGECVVSCRTEDNITYEFTCIVTQGAESISFDTDMIELILGSENKQSVQLKPILKPEGSTEVVTYTSRKPDVATVGATNGIVQAVAIGTTQIVATTSSGRAAIIDIVVSQAVTGLTQAYTSGTVYVGESITIAPDYVPATATNKTINWTWMSLDNKGEVSLSGTTSVTVTGVKTGTVSVIGVSEDNKAAMVSYVLSVKTRKPVYKTVVTLSPKVKYLNVGKTYTVKAKVTGAYKGNKKLKWKSSNKKVASVTQKGKVKAKKVGKATITATAQDGSKKKGTMKIIVRRLVTKIKMNKSSASILVGGSVKLSVKVTPGNATVKGVTWKSGDKSIATVVGGKVIGQAPGLVRITATSKDVKKKKAYCWVTVRERVDITSFTVKEPSLTVAKGKSVQSGISTNPANATTSVKYWSDNKSVATVSSRGKIKTHKAGQATIYARAANGVEAFVDVLVVDLNRKAVTLRQYDTEQLSVIGITKGITWYSLDPNIAKVVNGLVTARTPGSTIIYAKVDGVTLGCRVTVKKIR